MNLTITVAIWFKWRKIIERIHTLKIIYTWKVTMVRKKMHGCKHAAHYQEGEGQLELWGDDPGFNCFKGRRLWDSHVPTWQVVLWCRLQIVLGPACFYLSMLNHHPSTRTGCLYLSHSVPKATLATWIPSAPLWCLTSSWPAPWFWMHGPGEPLPSTAPLSLHSPNWVWNCVYTVRGFNLCHQGMSVCEDQARDQHRNSWSIAKDAGPCNSFSIAALKGLKDSNNMELRHQ